MAHLKLVLVQLARIHGLSYHMIEKYDGGLDRFKKDYYNMTNDAWFNNETQEMKEMMTMIFDSTFANYMAVLDKYMDDEALMTKVREFNKIRAAKVEAIHPPKEGGFNCLLHNDAWCNNFMFR